MKIWSKRAAGVGAILGGLLVAGTVAANASDVPIPLVSHAGDAASSLPLSSLPLSSLPLSEVSSQATSAASAVAPSKGQKNSPSKATRRRGPSTGKAGNTTIISGLANATSLGVDIDKVTADVPVTVCGNAVSVASNVTNAKCLAGKAGPKQPKGNKPPKGSPGAGGTSTKKISGALNGTTAVVDIGGVLLHIPINVCGNSVAVAANITNGAC